MSNEAALAIEKADAEYLNSISSDAAFAKAKEEGLVVVTPKANELFVDIDCGRDMDEFKKNSGKVNKLLIGILSSEVKPSKSGKPDKFHVVVTLEREITATERVLFQLLLGSDRMRELLSLVRIDLGDINPTLFFEKAASPPQPKESDK